MKKSNILFYMAICGLLSSCDLFKSSLGLDHYQPDEFSIPTNPPLEMPPNYKLKPPRTNDDQTSSTHVKDQNPADKAQEAIGVKKKSDETKVAVSKVKKLSSEQDNDDAPIVKKAKDSSQVSEQTEEKND